MQTLATPTEQRETFIQLRKTSRRQYQTSWNSTETLINEAQTLENKAKIHIGIAKVIETLANTAIHCVNIIKISKTSSKL